MVEINSRYKLTSFRAEYATEKTPYIEKQQSYNTFISQAIKDIKRGKRAYLYFSYQVDDIKKYFKDQVEIKYNDKENWWEATLKRL